MIQLVRFIEVGKKSDARPPVQLVDGWSMRNPIRLLRCFRAYPSGWTRLTTLPLRPQPNNELMASLDKLLWTIFVESRWPPDMWYTLQRTFSMNISARTNCAMPCESPSHPPSTGWFSLLWPYQTNLVGYDWSHDQASMKWRQSILKQSTQPSVSGKR